MAGKTGTLVILTGPSGVGKGSIVAELVKFRENLKLSTSVTTREKRSKEKDGVDYFFRTKNEFMGMVNAGEFLEYADYNSNYYGTPVNYVFDNINAGFNVILEIEVKGAFQVKRKHPSAVLIFVVPPSMAELVLRLRNRRTNTEDDIMRRLAIAESELVKACEFDYIVVNDKIENAVDEILKLI
ncbi:MAG: guanylate kinase [Oscillospiraceae bacterium]|nr:guanylate kinase [Oscillospiraceae bacterium]